MFGKRETIVFALAALVLLASVAGAVQIAEIRRDGEPFTGGEPAPGDADGDTIPDAADACVDRPETFNGFRDQDGCPDTVTRTRAS